MALYPEFDGKVLVATGGASLIVEALARQFVANGGSVVLGDLTTDHAHDVLSDVGEAGRLSSGAGTWRQHASSGTHRWM